MIKSRYTLLVTSILGIHPVSAYALSDQDITDIGDTLQWALPVAAYASTAIAQDWEGAKQYTASLGTTVIVTSLLKDTAEKMRPSSESRLSFPSGHTSAAFSGASFIDSRYGHGWGIPAYALAAFTGYSRINADAHHVDDVLAGMSVALFSNWYWVTPRSSGVSMMPVVMEDGIGVSVNVSEKGKNTMADYQPRRYPVYRYQMDFGPASLQENVITAPAATGTAFDLFDFEQINNPTTTANIILQAELSKYHTLGISIAPFEARDVGQFENPVNFNGSTYPAQTDLVSAFRRTDLRIDYSYNLIPDHRATLGVGASLAAMRTVVELSTADSTIHNKIDEWVVTPLLHVDIAYPLSSRWDVFAEANGAAWSDIDHLDTTLMFRYRFDRHWHGGIGRGEYDSKLEKDNLNVDLNYNVFKLSVGYTF